MRDASLLNALLVLIEFCKPRRRCGSISEHPVSHLTREFRCLRWASPLFVEWTCQVGCRLCGLAGGFTAQRVWFYGGRLRTESLSWVGWLSGFHNYRYGDGPIVWHPAGYLAAEQLKTLVFDRVKCGQAIGIETLCFQT